MDKFKIWTLFVFLFVTINLSQGIADLEKKNKYCVKQRSHKMVGYDCAKLDLREVPKKLQTSTEVCKK